jgi:hypothetical protein
MIWSANKAICSVVVVLRGTYMSNEETCKPDLDSRSLGVILTTYTHTHTFLPSPKHMYTRACLREVQRVRNGQGAVQGTPELLEFLFFFFKYFN